MLECAAVPKDFLEYLHEKRGNPLPDRALPFDQSSDSPHRFPLLSVHCRSESFGRESLVPSPRLYGPFGNRYSPRAAIPPDSFSVFPEFLHMHLNFLRVPERLSFFYNLFIILIHGSNRLFLHHQANRICGITDGILHQLSIFS